MPLAKMYSKRFEVEHSHTKKKECVVPSPVGTVEDIHCQIFFYPKKSEFN